jgi:hypothetical protein
MILPLLRSSTPAKPSATHLRIKTIKEAGRLWSGAPAGFYLGGSERAYPVPISTKCPVSGDLRWV